MRSSFGVTPNPYSIFNPPTYHTQMISDPTQVPYQLYPYGGSAYPYGLFPGFQMGQRPFTVADAQRHAKARHQAMIHRAEVSDDPSHKYLTSEGRLDPRTAAALRAAKMSQRGKREDPAKKLQKRIIMTVLLGSIISALLR